MRAWAVIMARCSAEFLVEPFREGEQGPHVSAAIEAVESAGLTAEIGPFGTGIAGDLESVARALDAAISAALANGATRVSVTMTVEP